MQCSEVQFAVCSAWYVVFFVPIGLARGSYAVPKPERIFELFIKFLLKMSQVSPLELQGVGGLMAAKTLWEGAIVPSLLHGAGTWVGSSEETDTLCDELQLTYWRAVFQVPKGTPKVMLTAETLSMKMKQRIWLMKLQLAKKILSQEKSLAKAIYQEQLERNWPGLSIEVREICKAVGLDDINKKDIKKEAMEEAIFFHNYKEMKQDLQGYKKLEDVKDNGFTKIPEYMEEKSLEKSRMSFRIKSKMVQSIKMNFKASNKGNLTCEKCEAGIDETQCHAMMCDGWKTQREGLDRSLLSDMVIFFTRLLEERGVKRD